MTLLARLARFASLSSQGELLCTQGLAHMLERDPSFLRAHLDEDGAAVVEAAQWRAEMGLDERGRVDLAAIGADGRIVAMIEGKLDAPFGDGQVAGYVKRLDEERGRALWLLVPEHRIADAEAQFTADAKASGIHCGVLTWEAVLAPRTAQAADAFEHDRRVLRDLYDAFVGNRYESVSAKVLNAEWESLRVERWVLADRLSRALLPSSADALPVQKSSTETFRYAPLDQVALPAPIPFYAVGIGTIRQVGGSPFWIRFHSSTPRFTAIRAALQHTLDRPNGCYLQDGHLYAPLTPTEGASASANVESMRRQAQSWLDTARQAVAG